MKTEYRIIDHHHLTGDICLQFKQGNTWRFVPYEINKFVGEVESNNLNS